MAKRDGTKFGYPPERDPFEPFPTTVPWDAPIAELPWWLDLREGGKTTRIGLRSLAAHQGWSLTLRELLPRLKRDGRVPDRVLLIKTGAIELGNSRGPGVDYHVLLGDGPMVGRRRSAGST